jgi:lysophospholipase L1-like esterase
MLDVAARIAFGPLLMAQARRLRRAALDLPEPRGPRRGTVGQGGTVLRVLVAGDSSAAGVGARTQRDALARPLAERLARRFGGAVRWQLIAQSGLTSEGVLEKLKHERPQPADVAVIVVGVNDITKEVPLAFALRQRQLLADWLQIHAGVRQVVFPALPEMELFPALPRPLAWYAGQAARRNNRAQKRWAVALPGVSHLDMDGVAHPSLFCEDGFHPAPALYARVADRLADHIAATTAAAAVPQPTPETR